MNDHTLNIQSTILHTYSVHVSCISPIQIKVQGARRVSSDGDNVSVTSGFSSLTEDATLQEAFMEAVSCSIRQLFFFIYS